MAGLSRDVTESLRATLQDAVISCSERCVYQAAKWAAELSASLSPPPGESADSDTDVDSPMEEEKPLPFPTIISASISPEEARLERKEIHKYLLAKSYFDCREFERCAGVFLPSNIPKGNLSSASPNVSARSPYRSAKGKAKDASRGDGELLPPKNVLPRLSQKSLFLALYAKFMAGEKHKDEETEMILGPQDKGSAVNKELVGISRSLEGWFATRRPDQVSGGWLEYLYGIVLARGKNEEDAKRTLIRSVHLFPFNWGAWLELNDLIGTLDELNGIMHALPQNLMTLIFLLYANQELAQVTEQIHSNLTDLERFFPNSLFLKSQRALLLYHSKEYDESDAIFSTILTLDPHRIDSLDHYSNLLYVMNARPKLAFLAQLTTATDQFRPETCCIVGNYYSLKSEHEKAVNYFRRALQLDRHFLSAWTLMGHEYVEMKNTHAAIESYRRAVDVNRKDYRAWYGLGQTYEVLEMHLYALFYFQRAAALRPYDPKMWSALGACYDKIGRHAASIKAYKRALVAGSYFESASPGTSFGSAGAAREGEGQQVMDPECLFAIAAVYEKEGELAECARYMELVLGQEEGEGGVTATTSKARMWLARWEFGRGGLERALALAEELCADGVEVEEAKALIRDLRSRMEAGVGDGGLGE